MSQNRPKVKDMAVAAALGVLLTTLTAGAAGKDGPLPTWVCRPTRRPATSRPRSIRVSGMLCGACRCQRPIHAAALTGRKTFTTCQLYHFIEQRFACQPLDLAQGMTPSGSDPLAIHS
jgi:hypothetical protein